MDNQTTTIAPPLDTDLNTVDTSLPLLSKGIYDLLIEKAELRPTSTPGGRLIHLSMKTMGPSQSMKAEPLGPGIYVFDNINVIATGKATPDMIKRGVASIVQAVPGGVPGAGLHNVDQWVPTLNGKTVKASVDYEPEGVSKTGKAFKAKNVVLLYYKA